MDQNVLTCYQSQHNKVRIGRDNDGGYVICELPNVKYGCLLSGGIKDDISFEEDCLKKYPYLKCYAFDGTINSINTDFKNIFFTKKNIGNKDNETNLHNIINSHENIFVKMDIEGSEVEWISTLDDNHLKKFAQIVIEIHYPNKLRHKNMFDKLNKHHLLVHIHANNWEKKIDKINGIIIPNVFECTYVNKNFLKEPYHLNTSKIPSNIDQPNCKDRPDIKMNYPPFFHKL